MIELTLLQHGEKKLQTEVSKNASPYPLVQTLPGFSFPCNGQGLCGKCRVQVTKGCPKPTKEDHAFLTEKDLALGFRLLCKLKLEEDAEILLPPKVDFVVTEKSSEESLLTDGEEGLGIALDLGTTTLALYLLDCTTGKELASFSAPNPQIRFGADVMSRIHYAQTNPLGRKELQDLLVQTLNAGVHHVCKEHSLDCTHIKKMVVVGNPTMLHIFFGEDPTCLGYHPYAPVFTAAREEKAETLGLHLKEALVYSPPFVNGFIGADSIGCLLSSRVGQDTDYHLLLDIGTNGEILLGKKGQILACTTAAGPAFEGAGITHGVPSILGAISYFSLQGGKTIKTLGDRPPLGICGSGLLDLVAELNKEGVLDASGAFMPLHPLLEKKEELRYPITDEIYLSQRDVRQLQLAKGALRAGVEILIQEAGISLSQVQTLYLAGGFGSYLRKESATQIGLLPKTLLSKVVVLGNAAGLGAKKYLLSKNERDLAHSLRDAITYVDLAMREDFQDQFMRAISLS